MTTSVEVAPAAPPPSAPLRPRMSWAPVPQVNLLPPEILAKRRFHRLRRLLAGTGLAVVVVCAAAVVWAQLGVSSAENDLATVQAQGAQLRAQQAKYAEVPKALAELDKVKAARESALGSDVAWYQFLSDLALNTPPGTQLTSVSVTMTGKTVAGTATAPLAPAGLGNVTVTGNALKYTDVAAWLDSVDQVHGLAGSGLELASSSGAGSSTTSNDGSSTPPTSSGSSGSSGSGSSSGSTTGTSTSDTITFSGSAVVVPAALSHRYDRKAD